MKNVRIWGGVAVLLVGLGCSAGGQPSSNAARGDAPARDTLAPPNPNAELIDVEIFKGQRNTGPPSAIEFVPLRQALPPGEVQVINGHEIEKQNFPATIQALGRLSCTGTLIGPRVLLTAAHCVDAHRLLAENRPMVVRAYATFDRRYELECKMHDNYASANVSDDAQPRASEDWALCLLADPQERPPVTPESVSLEARPMDATYFILGFGCTGVKKENGRLIPTNQGGHLLAGTDNMTFANVGVGDSSTGVYLVSRADGLEPSLCPGDSGGGVLHGPTLERQTASRRVTMVNSALGSKGDGPTLKLYSYFAPLSSPAFVSFARTWSGTDAARRICGIHITPGNVPCRG